MHWFGWIASIFGMLAGVWVLFRYLITVTVRLEASTFKTIYELAKDPAYKKFVLQEEVVGDSKYPLDFKALCWFPGAPAFFVQHGERLMTAGWISKDSVTMLTCFRWNHSRMKKYLTKKVDELQLEKLGIPVEVITPHYTDKIGVVKTAAPEPAINRIFWEDIAADADEVFSGKKMKSGALLYGPPGNNKTFFIKYLATKHKVPIKLITFIPNFTNIDLMFMFGQIPKRCIVLFEDFDNYFDGRTCILGTENHSVQFTFDTILNGLDGVYNTYEQVFFAMTVNNIDKVDWALKNRPSRFKFLRKFDNPELETRAKLLPMEWAEKTDGLNLDQIFRLQEFHAQGLSLYQARSNLGQGDRQKEIERLAYEAYQARIRAGLAGDPEGDWLQAEKKLGIK